MYTPASYSRHFDILYTHSPILIVDNPQTGRERSLIGYALNSKASLLPASAERNAKFGIRGGSLALTSLSSS
jgi:hypothetical protein